MPHFVSLAAVLLIFQSQLGMFSASAADLSSVTIAWIDGSETTGTLESIQSDGSLQGNDLPVDAMLADVLSVTSQQSSKPSNLRSTIELIDGGRLLAEKIEIDGEQIEFRSQAGISSCPLQNLRAIVWKTSPSIEQKVANPSTDKDSVFVSTDDGERRVEGIVESLDRQELQINFQNESRKISVDKIMAIVMADLGLERPAGPIATIQLTDGSTVVGSIFDMIDGKLNLKLSGAGRVAIDARSVSSFSIQSDRLQYLSDLIPVDVQQTTQFAHARTWQKDRSIENHPLSIRDGTSESILTFNKGIGTQAFTQLTFSNSEKFDRFNAIAGIDAETQGRGDCKMVVLGDGIELWSQRVRGSDQPYEIDVDISNMKEVTLAVYPGEDFDLADHADWADARFLKTK